MNQVLDFHRKPRFPVARPRPKTGPASIIIFPGIRYERRPADAVAAQAQLADSAGPACEREG